LTRLLNGGFKHQFLREFTEHHLRAPFAKNLLLPQEQKTPWKRLIGDFVIDGTDGDPAGCSDVLGEITEQMPYSPGFVFDVAVMVFRKN
jgi:hypothetical protein